MKMYYGVLQRVKRLEEKNGIHYATCEGKLYKTLKVFYIIAFAYGMAINLLFLLGMLFMGINSAKEAYYYILTPTVCSVLLIAGFVLTLKKVHIAGGILSAISAIVLAVFFIPLMEGDYVNSLQPQYYWRHLAPMAIILITGVTMSFIGISAKSKLKKMYNKVVENIYNTYKVNVADGEDISEEQWEEFLENFDPNDYNNQFTKKAEETCEEPKA